MKIQPRETHVEDSIIVFDIGGTWFRSAVLSEDTLRFKSKKPAINFKNYPTWSIDQLHQGLIEYFASETERLKDELGVTGQIKAGVSMGAALNGHTGEIFNSGPLWGPKSKPLNLLKALQEKQPETNWVVLNDVTAGLVHHVSSYNSSKHSRIMVVTVSTGIAARTYDKKTDDVPISQEYGLQGEVGHVPFRFHYRNEAIALKCDCGGDNHLNAFSSGRGIETVIKHVSQLFVKDYKNSLISQSKSKDLFGAFIDAVQKGDKFALEILDAVTFPLAQTLINVFTIDAGIDLILLTGGVVHSLNKHYVKSLLDNLIRIGLYQVTNQDPNFFEKRIQIAPDDDAELVGAGKFAKQHGDQIDNQKDSLIWRISAPQTVEYSIFEEPHLFSSNNSFLFKELFSKDLQREVVIFVDLNVYELYNKKISKYFETFNITAHIIPMSVSEGNKAMDNVMQIGRELDQFMVKRRDVILAVGGGVLLDIVGLAASLYRRGIPYIRIPTTLLALVDAGVGVKTAVNFNKHKNRLGTYYPATKTYLDKTFLRTLDERQICNGLAEILKIGIIKDARLFELLESHAEELVSNKLQKGAEADEVITRAVTGMLEELEPNLWETNLERLVDFGHTFSPAIEISALPNLLHGEAVAIDMIICSVISSQRGLLSGTDSQRIINLTKRLKLPVFHKVCSQSLMVKGLEDTTSHRGGLQRVPTPTAIGKAIFLNDITEKEISLALKVIRSLGKNS